MDKSKVIRKRLAHARKESALGRAVLFLKAQQMDSKSSKGSLS